MREHLKQGTPSSLRTATGLGRQAVALGMETLAVAGVHEQALLTVASTGGSARTRQKMIGRARSFFAEAIVPIERSHPAALNAGARATRMARELRERTKESFKAVRELKRGRAQRQTAEAALKKSGKRRIRLLQESRRLQNLLRDQTRSILSAQEDQRRTTTSWGLVGNGPRSA